MGIVLITKIRWSPEPIFLDCGLENAAAPDYVCGKVLALFRVISPFAQGMHGKTPMNSTSFWGTSTRISLWLGHPMFRHRVIKRRIVESLFCSVWALAPCQRVVCKSHQYKFQTRSLMLLHRFRWSQGVRESIQDAAKYCTY